jgi:hypothetical protein
VTNPFCENEAIISTEHGKIVFLDLKTFKTMNCRIPGMNHKTAVYNITWIDNNKFITCATNGVVILHYKEDFGKDHICIIF